MMEKSQRQPEPLALLNIRLKAALAPAVSFVKSSGAVKQATDTNSFSFELEGDLPYPVLQKMACTYLLGKRFNLSEGFFKQHVVIDDLKLYGGLYDNLVAEVQFSGSFSGRIFLTGIPFYNKATQTAELQKLDYKLETNNILLKGAHWLFEKGILETAQKYTEVGLAAYYKLMAERLDAFLNKEWLKGLQGTGNISQLEIHTITATKEALQFTGLCSGTLQILISELLLPI